MTVTGILTRVAAVGGESTGWAIRLDADVQFEGKPLKSIEVSGSREELVRFDNRHVDVSGRVVIRRGVERGEWPVLEITSIHEVGPK